MVSHSKRSWLKSFVPPLRIATEILPVRAQNTAYVGGICSLLATAQFIKGEKRPFFADPPPPSGCL